MSTWVSAGGKLLRCTAHPKVKPWSRSAPGGCSSCAAAGAPTKPAIVVAEVETDDTPVDCKSLEQHERWFTELALKLEKKADALDGKSDKTTNAAVKVYEAAIKAMARATELAHTRVRTRRVRRLEARARELAEAKKRAQRGAAN